jgi:hypothetical protein
VNAVIEPIATKSRGGQEQADHHYGEEQVCLAGDQGVYPKHLSQHQAPGRDSDGAHPQSGIGQSGIGRPGIGETLAA